MSKSSIFVDTNVILEALHLECWSTLSKKYAIETVEKCVEESFTGNHLTSSQQKALLDGLAVRHNPTKRDIANLILSHPQCQGLDDGELHLFAWLYAQKTLPLPLIISTADKAAIRATKVLGWFESLKSLQELLQKSGATKSKIDALPIHFSTSWLSSVKTNILLDIN
jgi:hypothetical protein